MIIGDSSRFAVEFELDEDPGGDWLNGQICFWICGQMIGDYESGTSLRDFLFPLERIHCDRGKRSEDYLMSLDTDALADMLYTSMYRCCEGDYLFQKAIDDEWACHAILPHVDVLDDWSVFLVENQEIARCVVYSTDKQSVVLECTLLPGEFDSVAAEVISHLLQWSDFD